jgi:hypothetical protein
VEFTRLSKYDGYICHEFKMYLVIVDRARAIEARELEDELSVVSNVRAYEFARLF